MGWAFDNRRQSVHLGMEPAKLVVPSDAIRAHQADLNLALYARTKGNGQEPATAASTQPLSKVIAEREESSKDLRQFIRRVLPTLERGGGRSKKSV